MFIGADSIDTSWSTFQNSVFRPGRSATRSRFEKDSWSSLIRSVVFGFGFLVLLTAILIVLLRVYVDFRKARMAAGNEKELRALVERFEELAATTAEEQRRTSIELAELRATVESVERLLRTVE